MRKRMQRTETDMAKIRMFCVKTIHFLLTCGLFFAGWLLFRYHGFSQIKDAGFRYAGFRYDYIVTAGFSVLLVFFNRTYNSYL